MTIPFPIAASISSASALLEELDRFRVLPREQAEAALAAFPGGGPQPLAEYLVSRGELTPYQAERALAGQAQSLLVGPYRLLEPHHVGSFGLIFRAAAGDREFALRVLPLRSLWQAKQARPLIRALASLADVPSVVPLVEADSANGNHYLVWPLTGGELLADRIRTRGPLPLTAALDLLIKLATALATCHERKIVHGLLTPRSVCLDSQGSPLLLEVGAGMLLARNLAEDDSLFDTMSSALAVSGAFEFAAPEWVANPATPTPAVDQYALAAVGYFALTGQPPAVDSRLPPNCVPRRFEKIIERMLQADPAARYPGMLEVRTALTARGSEVREIDVVDRSAADVRGHKEATVHFDLPPAPPEEAAPRIVRPITPRIEQRESTRRLPFAKPLVELDESTKPPELPAAPLSPAADRERGSRSWNVAPTGPQSRSRKAAPTPASLWSRIKQRLRLWNAVGDTIQVSVFGPSEVARSQSPQLTVFVHTPSVAASVGTLARAFHHDAVLLGTGPIAECMMHGTPLDVHVAVAHMAVANPLGGLIWHGQPCRLTYNLVVPWEAPLGVAVGAVSIGRSDVRIGQAEFGLHVRG